MQSDGIPLIFNVLGFFLGGSTAGGGRWSLGSGISICAPTEQTSGSVVSNWRALVTALSVLSYFSGSIFESVTSGTSLTRDEKLQALSEISE